MFLFVSFSLPLAPFSSRHFRERRITQDSEAKFKNHDRGDVAKKFNNDVAVFFPFVAVMPINRRDVFSPRISRLRALSACSVDFDSYYQEEGFRRKTQREKGKRKEIDSDV
jgi:hypothetical protein